MKIQINGEWKTLPSSLHEITIKQRADFQNAHGNLLDTMLKSILEIEDELERELELAEFQVTKMIKALSFFLNCTEEALRETQYLNDLAQMYFSSMALIFEEENKIIEIPEYEFIWQGSEWHLHQPELKNGDKMTFGEFIDSKQMIQNMIGLGKNRWECLIPLCAIYLRKEGEQYDESFLFEGSEQLKRMENLPLSIALQVGFFLTSSLNMLTTISPFSPSQESREAVAI